MDRVTTNGGTNKRVTTNGGTNKRVTTNGGTNKTATEEDTYGNRAGRSKGSIRWLAVVLASCLLAAACTASTSSTSPAGPTTSGGSAGQNDPTRATVEVATERDGFDDHTLLDIDTVETFEALARSEGSQSVVKLVIPTFQTASDVHWFDTNFYELHDEWFWFRLINGQLTPGTNMDPAEELQFGSIGEVYQWAEQQERADLPLDLRWISSRTFGRERLYSPQFYALALDTEPRSYGVGSIVRLTEQDATQHWLLELEYSDEPSPTEIAQFFDRRHKRRPHLGWRATSPRTPTALSATTSWSNPVRSRCTTRASPPDGCC
jgi:hypothetical protein